MKIYRPPSTIPGKFTNDAAVRSAQEAVAAYQKRQQPDDPKFTITEIAAFRNVSKMTFNWTCSSMQTAPRESCLLSFFDRASFFLKWDQAKCYKRELIDHRSLHQLLPKPYRDFFMSMSLMGEDAWNASAPNIRLEQITVIPRDTIDAVALSLEMVDYQDVVSHVSVYFMWPNTPLMIHYDELEVNEKINLRTLLVAKPPCLVIVLPMQKSKLSLKDVLNDSDRTGLNVFVHPNGQRTTLSNAKATFEEFSNSAHYTRDVWTPCAFLLDVAENPEKVTATFNLFKELPFPC